MSSVHIQEYLSAVAALNDVITKGKRLDMCFSAKDSPLAKQISYGVIRHYYELEAIVQKLLSKPLAAKHTDIQILLLAGIYSVDHLNRPEHASVNALVETSIGLKKKWAKSLINGVLRQYLRRREEIIKALESENNVEARYNHPLWLINRIRMAYPQEASSIFAANNIHAPMTLRVNLTKISRVNYQALLNDKGIESYIGKLSPSAIILAQAVSVDSLPGFAKGLVSIQDEASQLIGPLLNLQARSRVLDTCAAPGGKSCHMLELCPDISLTSLDVDQNRLEMIRENLDRLNIDCQTIACDLMNYDNEQKFDRILVDAPCSATGIIRRHPDIKLLRRDSDIDKLATTQLKLLAKAWSLLKEGGELVYSTCSILPTENEGILDSFLQKDESAHVISIDEGWGVTAGVGRVLLPNNNNHGSQGPDGFFFAKLKKISR